MIKFQILVNGQPFEVEIGELGDSSYLVTVAGLTFHIQLELPPAPTTGPLPSSATTPVEPTLPRDLGPISAGVVSPSSSPKAIVAPMPGRVLSIRVKPGDRIAYGDEVATVEAMKMEQSIRSDKEGIVSAVLVNAGDVIGYGTVIIELE